MSMSTCHADTLNVTRPYRLLFGEYGSMKVEEKATGANRKGLGKLGLPWFQSSQFLTWAMQQPSAWPSLAAASPTHALVCNQTGIISAFLCPKQPTVYRLYSVACL